MTSNRPISRPGPTLTTAYRSPVTESFRYRHTGPVSSAAFSTARTNGPYTCFLMSSRASSSFSSDPNTVAEAHSRRHDSVNAAARRSPSRARSPPTSPSTISTISTISTLSNIPSTGRTSQKCFVCSHSRRARNSRLFSIRSSDRGSLCRNRWGMTCLLGSMRLSTGEGSPSLSSATLWGSATNDEPRRRTATVSIETIARPTPNSGVPLA